MEIPFTILCYMHGEMKHRFDKDWWVCVGFDGEECPSFFTAEALHQVMHDVPIQDQRCLPAYWYRNPITDVVEITVGNKNGDPPGSYFRQHPVPEQLPWAQPDADPLKDIQKFMRWVRENPKATPEDLMKGDFDA